MSNKAKGKALTTLARLYGLERRWWSLEPDFMLRSRVSDKLFEVNSWVTTRYSFTCEITFKDGKVLYVTESIITAKPPYEVMSELLKKQYSNIRDIKLIDSSTF